MMGMADIKKMPNAKCQMPNEILGDHHPFRMGSAFTLSTSTPSIPSVASHSAFDLRHSAFSCYLPLMLNIWTNTPLPDSSLSLLRAGIGPNRLLVSTQLTNILKAAGPDPLLADADIAFGQPDPDQLLGLTRLKWVHLSTAGYTRYDRPDLRQSLATRKILITNSSSVFDEPCAEHTLAFILAAARDFPAAIANQLSSRDWPQDNIRMNSRLLTGQSVLILSFGAIARRLVELLAPLGMKIRAARRTPRKDEPIPVYPMADVDKLLPDADHVVNILPADASTTHFMNARRFTLMKSGSVFYNIGRGTTVDQPALIESLTTKHLAAAYLDVTDPEPLPPNHPLWTTPNCFITPHTAGGHANEFDRTVDHFLQNLKRFESSKSLLNQIFS
jgi:phosphoglycerate dehydrogenase-like enzyme